MLPALPFRLLLVTDEAACARAGRGVLDTVARALPQGGSGIAVLLRAKALAPAALLEQARALRALTRERGALLFVHGAVQVARSAGADGLHLADGVSRPLAPSGLLVGASRHEGALLDEAHTEGLAYVALAPVFAPSSKPGDPREPLGLAGLVAHVGRSKVPVVALGGVDATNAGACLEACAAAVAVLGGVMAAAEPARAVADLLLALTPRGR